MSKKVKIFAIIVGIISVGILAYTFFGNNSPRLATTPLTSSAAVPGAMPTALPGGGGPVTTMPGGIGGGMNTFSNALAGISGITLDTSIFSNPAYKALRDYPITLGTAVIGRQNPFAPIGADSGSASTITSAPTLTVQTLAPSNVLTTSATFGALITAQGNTSLVGTTVVFQYGTDDTLGSALSPVTVTTTGTAVSTVTGLTPGTTYYVNSVAVQGSTTATGTIMTFTTAGTAAH